MRTAVVRFSGICTHINKAPNGDGIHRVVLADVSTPSTYDGMARLAGLPPHTAALRVAKSSVLHAEPALDPAAPEMLSWELHHNAWIGIVPDDGDRSTPLPLQYDGAWSKDIPSVSKLAPLPPGAVALPLDLDIASRSAATLSISFGTLLPVDHDPETGNSAAEWRFPAKRVKVMIRSRDLDVTLKLRIPQGGTTPGEPLIRIQNGTATGDSNDFLFHYYLLFNDVPANARLPRGGTVPGCSNSNYP